MAAVHPYAQKLPKGKLPTCPIERIKMEEEQKDLATIVDAMLSDRSLISPMHATLKNLLNKQAALSSSSEQPFPSCYNNLGRLPTYWMSAHVQSMSRGALTKSMLEELTKNSPQVVRQIFHFAHATSDSDYLPRSMLSKEACKKQLTLRYQQCGNRLEDFARHIRAGQVDWKGCGPYTVNFLGDKANQITYLTKLSATPKEHQVITRKFQLIDWHSDKLASLTLEGTTYCMRQFFPQNGIHSPWRMALSKKSQELEDLKPTSSSQSFPTVEVDETFGLDAQKATKRNQLAIARENAKKRKAEKQSLTLEEVEGL